MISENLVSAEGEDSSIGQFDDLYEGGDPPDEENKNEPQPFDLPARIEDQLIHIPVIEQLSWFHTSMREEVDEQWTSVWSIVEPEEYGFKPMQKLSYEK